MAMVVDDILQGRTRHERDVEGQFVVRRMVVGNDAEFCLQEVQIGSPAAGEVLVAVEAVSLNRRDLLMLRRTHPRCPAGPFVPCSDASGQVIAVGRGVRDLEVGDHVISLFQPGWSDGVPAAEALAPAVEGVLASLIVRPEAAVLKVDRDLDFAAASTLPCAATAAWSAVVVEGGAKWGETVLVQGAGGVSLFAIAFAKALGCRVVAVTRSEEKVARLSEVGADDVVVGLDGADWADQVRALTGRAGVQVAIDIGGATTLAASLRSLAVNGRLIICGMVGGDMAMLPLDLCIGRHISIRSVSGGSRASIEAMMVFMRHHGIQPVIEQVFPLADAVEAFDRLDMDHIGKICILVRK